jgi:D-alanine-D-alanine ligase
MRIAVITGGETAERDISIASAKNIKSSISFAESKLFVFPEDKEIFLKEKYLFTIVIPVIHGIGGEDGKLQFFLEQQKIPYIFSNPKTHAIGINKRKSKIIASTLGFMVPREFDVSDAVFPLFVKPVYGGSSVASKICNSVQELESLFFENQQLEFMLEEPINGREFTVGIVESEGKTIPLPVIEIIPKEKFFDFESKYSVEKLAQEICPAQIEETLKKTLQSIALSVHQKIGTRHISRSDFIVTSKNEVYFLEINTIPGMTNTSLIPKMLKEANLNISKLLREWCCIG